MSKSIKRFFFKKIGKEILLGKWGDINIVSHQTLY